MVQALRAFLEFCYIAHRNIHDTWSLEELDKSLEDYHHYRNIFLATGIQIGFNLPHQHALIHYLKAIHLFGAPNGLCSSIMESKHIKAVKEPWQQSSCFNALCQMLLSNQHADKLAASRANFKKWGMLQGTCLSWILIQLGMLPGHCCLRNLLTWASAQALHISSVNKNLSPSFILELRYPLLWLMRMKMARILLGWLWRHVLSWQRPSVSNVSQ